MELLYLPADLEMVNLAAEVELEAEVEVEVAFEASASTLPEGAWEQTRPSQVLGVYLQGEAWEGGL